MACLRNLLLFLFDRQLQSNNLSGSIPQEIGKLLKLEQLDLSNNHFSGDIPKSIGNLKTLQYL